MRTRISPMVTVALISLIGVGLLVASGPLPPTSPANRAVHAEVRPSIGPFTTITACNESTLTTAVAAGGTVSFGASCSDLKFTQTISIGAKLKVVISGNGHTVVFDGQGSTQLFIVTGGHLTITGITLLSILTL